MWVVTINELYGLKKVWTINELYGLKAMLLLHASINL